MGSAEVAELVFWGALLLFLPVVIFIVCKALWASNVHRYSFEHLVGRRCDWPSGHGSDKEGT